MASAVDAVVVGGGHNGLVAAAYLARAGLSTVVVEARHATGGASTTEAPWPEAPEVRVSRLSYVMSLMPASIIDELDLRRHGYRVHPMGPYYQAYPEGGSIRIHADDPARTHESVARWSRRDADALARWDAWFAGLAAVVGPLLSTVPPRLGSHRPADVADTLRLAWRHKGLDVRTVADVTRLLTMSVADLLDEWFESPQVKGALALNGVIGTWGGPCEAGTAYVMADQSMGDVGDGRLGSWGFPEGGMGAVAAAIEGSAVAAGARVRTSSPVERVLVRGGAVAGVVLRGGEEIEAATVVSSVHPRLAFLDHVGAEHLPDDFVRDIRRWKSRSGVVKINLAVSELPDFTADPGTRLQDHHTGSIGMAPTVEYIERAFQDAREGRPSLAPFSDGVIPTTLDRTLAPDGIHVVSLFTQWVPAGWCEAPHREELEAYADRIVDLYDQVAPNFKASIRRRDILGPYDLEHEYGLVGGNIFHGELSLDQLFHLRPAPGYSDYRTPIRGLYYASSATHPAGGVSGIPGRHAAHAVLADRRRASRSRSRSGAAAPRWLTRAARAGGRA